MMLLEIEPMDLGEDVRAIGLELLDGAEKEPVRGQDAAPIWSAILPALTATEPWALDLIGNPLRMADFCNAKGISCREVSKRSLVITPLRRESTQTLLERFATGTFGIRAGNEVQGPDSTLEGELASRGLDAYQAAYHRYFFCAICDLDDGSLVVLSRHLWATELVRRVRPALAGSEVDVRIASSQ